MIQISGFDQETEKSEFGTHLEFLGAKIQISFGRDTGNLDLSVSTDITVKLIGEVAAPKDCGEIFVARI